MNKKMLLTILMLAPMTTQAVPVKVFGNNISCGKWAKGPFRDIGFMLGVLTGLALAEGKKTVGGINVLADVDADSAEVWVTNYCKANPLDTVMIAANELFDELRNRKVRGK